MMRTPTEGDNIGSLVGLLRRLLRGGIFALDVAHGVDQGGGRRDRKGQRPEVRRVVAKVGACHVHDAGHSDPEHVLVDAEAHPAERGEVGEREHHVDAAEVRGLVQPDACAEGKDGAVRGDQRVVRREVLAAQRHQEGGELDDEDVHKLQREAALADQAVGRRDELRPREEEFEPPPPASLLPVTLLPLLPLLPLT